MAARLRRSLSTLLAAAALSVGALVPTSSALAQAPDGETSASVFTEGPHAPVGRRAAPLRVVRVDGAVVREADLGDIDLGHRPGQFRSPVRGILVTPAAARRAPLVVIAHLRNPECLDDSFQYPCARGAELRYDRGMIYAGIALTRRGYSVLIPDLGPLYVGGGLDADYDQYAGFVSIVGRLESTAQTASAGRTTAFGSGLTGAIDASHTGLLVHSRSAYMIGALTRAWARTGHPVAAVMAYGPAFDTTYGPDPYVTPMIPDVPFLGAVGSKDSDTSFNAQMWLSAHVGTSRRSPALGVVVPGLGHTYVNRALSSRHADDRICDGDCADVPTHERFLTTTAIDWFDATLRHRPTTLPLTATSPLPATLSGLPARWIALTNAPHVTAYLGGVRGRLSAFGPGASARECLPPEPMVPGQHGTCAPTNRSAWWNSSAVTQVRVTPTWGVRLSTRVIGTREIVLQLAPSDDRADRAPGSPLRIRVRTLAGRTAVIDVPQTHPALVNRHTAIAGGDYTVTTLRVAVPTELRVSTITSLELTGGTRASAFDIRAIDLVGRAPGR